MEKIHFEQARIWLEGAKNIANNQENSNKYAVAISMLIHAVIKANDALTIKFLNVTARRHDDAIRLFKELIDKNLIKPEYSNYRQILQEAINNKAKAEYRGTFFSKNDYEKIKKTQRNL